MMTDLLALLALLCAIGLLIAIALWREQIGWAWRAMLGAALVLLGVSAGRASVRDDDEDEDDDGPDYTDRLDEVIDEADDGDDFSELDDDDLADRVEERFGR